MKNKFSRLLLTAITTFCLIAPAVHGQTTNNAPATNTVVNPASFFDEVKGYFTTINTNLTWTNTPFAVYTSMNYENGVNTSMETGVSYDVWHMSPVAALSLNAAVDNLGALGTFVSQEGGVGVSLFHYDIKVTGYVDLGESEARNSLFTEFGANFDKKVTPSSFIGVGVGYKKYFNGPASDKPEVKIRAGFTF